MQLQTWTDLSCNAPGGKQEEILNSRIPETNLVPNTPTSTQISVTGEKLKRCCYACYQKNICLYTWKCVCVLDIMIYCVWLHWLCLCLGRENIAPLVENAISGQSMGTLIYQPSGCGEQNMIHMTLPVIAAIYLDKTNQWESVGFQRRNEALEHVKTGKTTQKTLWLNCN